MAVDRSISHGQLATEEKSSEITAIPELLDNIEIKGAVVTTDPAKCQREIAKKVIDGVGDFVLALEGDQGKLHDSVRDYITKHIGSGFADIKVRRYAETLKGQRRAAATSRWMES